MYFDALARRVHQLSALTFPVTTDSLRIRAWAGYVPPLETLETSSPVTSSLVLSRPSSLMAKTRPSSTSFVAMMIDGCSGCWAIQEGSEPAATVLACRTSLSCSFDGSNVTTRRPSLVYPLMRSLYVMMKMVGCEIRKGKLRLKRSMLPVLAVAASTLATISSWNVGLSLEVSPAEIQPASNSRTDAICPEKGRTPLPSRLWRVAQETSPTSGSQKRVK